MEKNQSACLLSVHFIDHQSLPLQSCLAEIEEVFSEYNLIEVKVSVSTSLAQKGFGFLKQHYSL
jgi:hypothetical protein